jgi:hypothetical protein
MNFILAATEETSFTELHPAVQVTIILCGTLLALVFLWLIFKG